MAEGQGAERRDGKGARMRKHPPEKSPEPSSHAIAVTASSKDQDQERGVGLNNAHYGDGY